MSLQSMSLLMPQKRACFSEVLPHALLSNTLPWTLEHLLGCCAAHTLEKFTYFVFLLQIILLITFTVRMTLL